MSVRAALDMGRREALDHLAGRLAAEVDTTTNPRDRLAVVRAFLSTMAQLEAIDTANARNAPRDPPDPVDTSISDLLERRRRRRGRATA